MVIIQARTVSAYLYPLSMSEKPKTEAEGKAVFIEVPKPVKDMSEEERDSFVEEILNSLEEQR